MIIRAVLFCGSLFLLFFPAACSRSPLEVQDLSPEVINGTVDFPMNAAIHDRDLFGAWSAPRHEKGEGLARRVLKPDSGFFFDILKVEPLVFTAEIANRPGLPDLRINGSPLPPSAGRFEIEIPAGFLRPGRNKVSFAFPPGEKIAFKRIRIFPVRGLPPDSLPGSNAVLLTPARLQYYLPSARRAELRLAFDFEDRQPLSAVVTIELEKKTASYGLKIHSKKEIAIKPLDDGYHRIQVELGETAAGHVRLLASRVVGNSRRPVVKIPAGSAPGGKNVLIIVLDAARADHFGCYGYARPTTPRIDALAVESAVFRDAVSESAYTLASTGTMLTGLPPDYHGVTKAFSSCLDDEVVTITQLFERRGYFTAAISTNPFFGKAFHYHKGFARFIDFRNTGRLIRAEDFLPPFLELLGERSGKPFFFYFHIREPHSPYSMPKPFHGMFRKKDPGAYGPETPKAGKRAAKKAVLRFNREFRKDLYDENLAYADSAVGKICEALKDKGLYDQTVILVTADHGEALGEHGLVGHNVVLNREGIHIPMILRIPDEPRSWKAFDHPVIPSDAVITLCRLCGLPYPYVKKSRGRDLFSPDEKRIRFCRSMLLENGYTGYMVESDPYKMILFPSDLGISIELFNVRQDPEERNSLAADALPAKALRFFLRDFLLRASRWDPGEDRADLTPEDIDRLRSLGYVK